MTKIKIKNFSLIFLIILTFLILIEVPIVEFYKFYLMFFFISSFLLLKIKNFSYIKILFLFLIIILTLFYNNDKKIKIGHNLVILNQYSSDYYKQNLPEEVFHHFKIIFSNNLIKSQCGNDNDACWKSFDPFDKKKSGWNSENFFYRSSNILFNRTNYTDISNYINVTSFKSLKVNSINNLNFNFYNKGIDDEINNRNKLPFFIYYELPSKYSKNKICWKGNIFLEQDNKIYKNYFNENYECKKIFNKNSNTKFYAVSDGTKDDIILKFYNFDYLVNYVFLILFILIIFRYYLNIDFLKLTYIFIYLSLSFLVLYYINKDYNFGFSVFSGGNDGILYMSYSNKLYHYLTDLNFYEFFRGMESIFYLPSSLRFFWVLNKIFFGETIYGYLLIILIFPYIIYLIFNYLVDSKKYIFFIFLFFAFSRLFEGYAFSNITMLQHVYAGDAEPLAIFFLIFSILIFFNIEKKNYLKCNFLLFITGIFIFFSISLRPNYLPTGFLFLIILSIRYYLFTNSLLNLFYLYLGFTFIILIPMHNYIYGNEYVLLTSGVHHNTHAPISLWIDLVQELFKLNNFNASDHELVFKQVNRWIKPQEFHYLISLIFLICTVLFTKNFKIISISLLAISQHLVCLIYEPEGRYSYLAWFLTIIVLIYFFSHSPYLLKRLNKLINYKI